MANIQDKLNEKYSDRNNTESIEIIANGYSGNLLIENYSNLKSIKILSSIDSVQKGKITNIQLIDLPNLEKVEVTLCGLEELIFQKCPNISTLRLRKNKLSNLNFLGNLDAEKLTYLSIINNNIQEQELDYFRHFVNLEVLKIGNEKVSSPLTDKRGNNQFKGSLEPLKNLTKLKSLHISKTNIDSGLEHLPLSLENIYCDGSTDFVKPRTKFYQCSAIEKILKNGNWRKSRYIEQEGYFSIETQELEQAQKEYEALEAKYGKERMNQLRKRNIQSENQLDSDYLNEQNFPFWTNPATANKIACCNVNATIFGGIIALMVGIPAYLALGK